MWTALYMPALPDGSNDPSRKGFPTQAAALSWVFSHMCAGCTSSRNRFLAGEVETEDGEVAEFPSCSWEWDVVLTAELLDCEDIQQIQEVCRESTSLSLQPLTLEEVIPDAVVGNPGTYHQE